VPLDGVRKLGKHAKTVRYAYTSRLEWLARRNFLRTPLIDLAQFRVVTDRSPVAFESVSLLNLLPSRVLIAEVSEIALRPRESF
jgi:hypothetical protein